MMEALLQAEADNESISDMSGSETRRSRRARKSRTTREPRLSLTAFSVGMEDSMRKPLLEGFDELETHEEKKDEKDDDEDATNNDNDNNDNRSGSNSNEDTMTSAAEGPPQSGLRRIRSREDITMKSNAKISRVEKSWYIISNKIGEVGLRFFLRMFDDHPELVHLFPFGDDAIDQTTGKLKLNHRTKAHVQAHATAVMRVVGTCVAGITNIEELIPRLRQVGATHKTVGVQAMHYDILYRHLVLAIQEEVGPDNWDQETEDAWEQAFASITDLIKRPSKRLETEPLRGWGIVMLMACSYFMIVTPFRFAGFIYGRPNMVLLLDVLDAMASLVLAIDLLVEFVQSKLRVRRLAPESDSSHSDSEDDSSQAVGSIKKQTTRRSYLNKMVQRFVYHQRRAIVKLLQKSRMDRWVPWPSLDIRVLLSFPLQWLFIRTSICAQVGLHWTQLFGLLRVSTAFRVQHFLQCAENNAILEQKLSAERQLHLRVVKLILRLAFIIHISACLWCIVARVELGVGATEFTPSTFFPDSEVLYGPNSDVFNSYSRAIHWAFVNLAGIGDVDSSPVTTLECWFILFVHLVGALFYAVVTGNVITILEENAQRDNKIGSDIMRLSNYMDTARVAEFSKERIMKGYMMRNVLTQAGQGGAQGPRSDKIDLEDEILATLPNYLRVEVAIYARAELIRRREKFFSHCSNGFLVALSSSLSQTRTLLTGDYLMRRGEPYVPEFVLVESGSLQVRHDNHTIQTLERGDCLGKAWLLQSKHDPLDPEEFSEKTDWLMSNGMPAVSIRALEPCVLLTGLSTLPEIDKLKRGYRVDFRLMMHQSRSKSKDEIERQSIAIKGIAKAVRRFKARKSRRSTMSARQSSVALSASQSEALKLVMNGIEQE